MRGLGRHVVVHGFQGRRAYPNAAEDRPSSRGAFAAVGAVSAAPPWLRFDGKVPDRLDYPECSLYRMIAATARRTPDAPARDFFDTTASYRALLASIDRCADALHALGLGQGDRLLIALPTMTIAANT
ncbi:MAG: hypothetical protein EPN49_04510 [Rhodanobacter sp.]|nr:MAG: hypothetical protein EPN49_04510 [Rhodanobacter sp.]